MRKLLLTLVLVCTSFVFATPVFQEEVADSLIVQIKEYLNSNESYYLVNSKQHKLDSYLLLSLSNLATDIRTDQDLATKSISFSITESITNVSKRSFLFSREIRQSEFLAEAKIIDNKTSKLEHHINFSKLEETPIQDGEITLWKSTLISLMAGTLIYSLWSIE